MTKIKYLLFAIVCLTLTNCNTPKHKFPLDKRYWNINDYTDIILELNFDYKNDEKKPTFDNPETRLIVEKLTDQQNFKVVLDDNELGLKHRNEVATAFFKHWTEMQDIYVATDRKDNYIYDKEMLAVWHFGLSLQLYYFKLGNDEITERTVDPNSVLLESTINSNVKTLISNYSIYLDLINNEKAYSEEGKTKLAKGIDNYFTQMINLYPKAYYGELKKKAELLLKKSTSNHIKASLTTLIRSIDSLQKEV